MISKQENTKNNLTHGIAKRNLLIATVMLLTLGLGNSAKAQKTPIRTVTVNVKLKDVIAIGTGGAGNGVVDFIYDTAKDYENEKSVPVPGQLNITSTKPYDVYVRGIGAFREDGTAEMLPLDILNVNVKMPEATAFNSPEVVLTETDQQAFSLAPASMNQAFDVLYRIPKNKSELLLRLIGNRNDKKEQYHYKTDVIYSIAAL